MVSSGKSKYNYTDAAFPTNRRPKIRKVSNESREKMEEWFAKCGARIGPLCLTKDDEFEVVKLLYTYKDLDATELSEMPATDLYTHDIKIKEGTVPYSARSQKRWPRDKEWWLNKMIQDGLDCGMYEPTTARGEGLSPWNAAAKLVPKSDDDKWGDEPRITFNYHNVKEDLPGYIMPLMSEVHDFLSQPSHGCFIQLDLKNAYWSIPLNIECRKYLAFTLNNKPQLQPTRLPQGSQSATFGLTQCMNIALGAIPKLPEGMITEDGKDGSEPSLLHQSQPDEKNKLKFYMDDIFGAFQDFKSGYAYLRDHLLPRIAWAKFRLSFKKLRLFMDEIEALGVVHKIRGVSVVKYDRAAKIKQWPIPKDFTDVKSFVASVMITKPWVKNFSEIAMPLNRLMRQNAIWVWGVTQQAAFDTLKFECAAEIERHGLIPNVPIMLYTDASKYAIGCVITQYQYGDEVPILYDSCTLSKSEQNYGTYKRELLAIVTFAKKYDYLFLGKERSIIYTDHKPLAYFMESSLLEGIYTRWNHILSQLNIEIQWISGCRNEVADALSRTVFLDPSEGQDELLMSYGKLVQSQVGDAKWIWKDGKGGYLDLIRKRRQIEVQERTDTICFPDTKISREATVDVVEAHLLAMAIEDFVGENPKYEKSIWFKDFYNYQRSNLCPQNLSHAESKRFLCHARRYRILGEELYVEIRGKWKRCVTESEVSQVLEAAHDNGGHYGSSMTMKRLKDYYWPKMSKDTVDYILGCMSCATHGIARRSQTQSSARVDAPLIMLGMDFIGPLPEAKLSLEETIRVCNPQLNSYNVAWESEEQPSYWGFSGKKKFTHIFVVVDYFSRFVWAFPCSTPDQAEAIRCLIWLFSSFGIPVSIYADIGTHFTGRSMMRFLQDHKVLFTPAPSGAKRATGMVEKSNDLLEMILKKQSNKSDWPLFVNRGAYELNRREIKHLGFSPYEILLGYQPPSTLEIKFPSIKRSKYISKMADFNWDIIQNVENVQAQDDAVVHHVARMQTTRSEAVRKDDWRRKVQKEKHDIGISQNLSFIPGSLVMLYDHARAKLKLHASYRGPFVVAGFAGEHKKSYLLRQVDGQKIKYSYHGDQLRPFRLREGYLITGNEKKIPAYQNLRSGKASFEVPKPTKYFEGSWTRKN